MPELLPLKSPGCNLKCMHQDAGKGIYATFFKVFWRRAPRIARIAPPVASFSEEPITVHDKAELKCVGLGYVRMIEFVPLPCILDMKDTPYIFC